MAEVKILICDMNNKNGFMLQWTLVQNKFKNVVFQPDITELKNKVSSYKPDIIISRNHLWENKQGIRFLTEQPVPGNTHIIIWSDHISEDIISSVFQKNNLHLIKKDNEKELIEIIRKVKPYSN